MSRKSFAIMPVVVFALAGLSLLAGGCGKEAAPSTGPAATATVAASPFVNSTCPIMGNPINSASVPQSLTREYKGQKVAFCCAMCPPAWDKLTDAEKDAKLAKVIKH